MPDSSDIPGIDDAVGQLADRLERAAKNTETFAGTTPRGIGIDHIPLARVGRRVAVDRLLTTIATPSERRTLFADAIHAEQVAQLFCVKEACAKAMGLGFGPDLDWVDLVVASLDKGSIRPVSYEGDGADWRLVAGSDIVGDVAFAVAIAGR